MKNSRIILKYLLVSAFIAKNKWNVVGTIVEVSIIINHKPLLENGDSFV